MPSGMTKSDIFDGISAMATVQKPSRIGFCPESDIFDGISAMATVQKPASESSTKFARRLTWKGQTQHSNRSDQPQPRAPWYRLEVAWSERSYIIAWHETNVPIL